MYRIANEVDAVFGGLIAQEQQPIFLGPIPDSWKPAIEAQHDLYYAGLEQLTPEKSFAEFIDFVNGFGEKRGLKSLMLMHGRGYGDDGPLFTPQNRGARNRDVLIEKGNVLSSSPLLPARTGALIRAGVVAYLSPIKAASRWSSARREWLQLHKKMFRVSSFVFKSKTQTWTLTDY
jgi:hypothetical protein